VRKVATTGETRTRVAWALSSIWLGLSRIKRQDGGCIEKKKSHKGGRSAVLYRGRSEGEGEPLSHLINMKKTDQGGAPLPAEVLSGIGGREGERTGGSS